VDPAASVIIVNYEGSGRLARCLDAVARLRGVKFETIVVDNASTDGSWRVADRAGVRLVRNERNIGFGRACNQAALVASGRHLAFLNFDSVPEPGWLAALVAVAEADPTVGAVQGIVLTPDGGVNTAGNRLHYLGFSWAPHQARPPSGEPYEIAVGSGAALLVPRALFAELGGFWDAMFLYCEDTDLSWRLRLAGWRIVAAPAARSVHDYEFARNPWKMFHLERNRLLMIAANYEAPTLLRLAPALAVTTVGLLAVSFREGWLPLDLRALCAALRAVPEVRRQRARVHARRLVGDDVILRRLESELGAEFGGRLVHVVNPCLRGYARVARLAVGR
jgi:GT2 family glycosyltransferase